ncbi:hypothetical protein DFQ26_000421 [Actinomortierella ambigua]|nr:hypothetical protein DFQ26_000421 [Actinomortierella ambigua]
MFNSELGFKVDGPVNVRSFADGVYVPRRIGTELSAVLKKFYAHEIFLELALGLALIAVEPTENWVNWKETYLWSDDARAMWRTYLEPDMSMLHPVKLALDPKAGHDVAEWIETVEAIPLHQ